MAMMLTAASGAESTTPPYPAALSSSATTWQSQLARGGSVPLIRPEIHLGRLAGNDLVVQDAGVSRVHAVIRWTPTAYVIQDLGSANGTYVDDRPIAGPTALQPGQRIRIGGVTFLFQAMQVTGTLGAVSEPPSSSPSQPAAPHSAGAGAAGVGTVKMPPVTQSPLGGPGTVTLMPAAAVQSAAHHLQRAAIERWLRSQLPKYYWRVFVVALAAYIIAAHILNSTGNTNTVPLVVLLASAVVPVSFVVFCWEQGAFVDIPPLVVGIAFVSGSTVGLLLAAYLEPQVVRGSGMQQWLLVALCEETAKVAAVAWFLRDKRLRTELDGLVLGAAAGMGFAALETAGYGFSSFLQVFINSAGAGNTVGQAFQAGVSGMIQELNLRMELAVFGHGVWTAILCAAIWRERGTALFRLTPGVVLAFAIAVGLHTAWDSVAGNSIAPNLVVGVVGLLVLRFFILDAIDQARRGAPAQPAPLLDALRAYFRFLFDRAPQVAATLQRFLGAVAAAPAGAGAGPSGQGAPTSGSAQSTAGPAPAAGTAGAAANAPTAPGLVTPVAQPAAAMPSASPPPSTAAAGVPYARCAACGQLSPATARFCGHCGGRLSS